MGKSGGELILALFNHSKQKDFRSRSGEAQVFSALASWLTLIDELCSYESALETAVLDGADSGVTSSAADAVSSG
jgi:hypothetical protein